MSTNLKKDQLASQLEKLAEIKQCPRLFLANYFADLRADVDYEMAKKQHEYREDQQKKEKTIKIWLLMIAKINSFEKLCINSKLTKETIENALNTTQ